MELDPTPLVFEFPASASGLIDSCQFTNVAKADINTPVLEKEAMVPPRARYFDVVGGACVLL